MTYYELSKKAKLVADEIDSNLAQFKDSCIAGILDEEEKSFVVLTVSEILSGWKPVLDRRIKSEVTDWFYHEYRIIVY